MDPTHDQMRAVRSWVGATLRALSSVLLAENSVGRVDDHSVNSNDLFFVSPTQKSSHAARWLMVHRADNVQRVDNAKCEKRKFSRRLRLYDVWVKKQTLGSLIITQGKMEECLRNVTDIYTLTRLCSMLPTWQEVWHALSEYSLHCAAMLIAFAMWKILYFNWGDAPTRYYYTNNANWRDWLRSMASVSTKDNLGIQPD